MSITERNQVRWSFDANAAVYDRGRPGYPDQLFEEVTALSGLPLGGRILEIGAGTGHATLPFARRGYVIDSIELGTALAKFWQENLKDFPNASIRIGQFEETEVPAETYDLAIAASSFHWIDPDIGYAKVARALNPGGAIALWWNRPILRANDQPYVEQLGPLYSRLAPELLEKDVFLPAVDEVPAPAGARIAESGLFGPVVERRFTWSRTFDTEAFVDLLGSYSRYSLMDATVRERLFGELRTIIDDKFGGSITRGMVTLLYVATKD